MVARYLGHAAPPESSFVYRAGQSAVAFHRIHSEAVLVAPTSRTVAQHLNHLGQNLELLIVLSGEDESLKVRI